MIMNNKKHGASYQMLDMWGTPAGEKIRRNAGMSLRFLARQSGAYCLLT